MTTKKQESEYPALIAELEDSLLAVIRARDMLDHSTVRCEHCGHNKSTDQADRMHYEKAVGAIAKIQHIIEYMRSRANRSLPRNAPRNAADVRRVGLTYSTEEARGRVEMTDTVYGPAISVNGREVVFIDLYDPDVIAVHLSNDEYDEPLAQMVVEKGKDNVLVVNGHAEQDQTATERVIHSDGSDTLYVLRPKDGGPKEESDA